MQYWQRYLVTQNYIIRDIWTFKTPPILPSFDLIYDSCEHANELVTNWLNNCQLQMLIINCAKPRKQKKKQHRYYNSTQREFRFVSFYLHFSGKKYFKHVCASLTAVNTTSILTSHFIWELSPLLPVRRRYSRPLPSDRAAQVAEVRLREAQRRSSHWLDSTSTR